MSEKENELQNEELQENIETPEEENIYISKEATHKVEKAPQKRWYVVHTYSGYENKVKVNLEKRIEYMNMGEKIFRIEVPQKTVTQVRGGKKTKKEEKIFPGYVLVEMIMDDDSWYVVRHTAGVTKFVGTAKKPIAAKDSEIKKIIHRGQQTTAKIELDVKVGDKVKEGDLLVKVDLDFFRTNNVCMVSPIIVTNANQRKIKLLKSGEVEAKEKDILSITA